MKFFKRVFLISFLLLILIYVTNITALPDSVILFKNEGLDIKTVFGINIEEKNNYEAIQTSSKINNENILNKTIANVSLFNIFNIKEIEVNTIPRTTVIPLGNSIGLKLYTNGVLVVGLSQIDGQKPYENSGITEGDVIVKINEKEITCTSDLISIVSNSKGEDLNIQYLRDGKEHNTNIEPIKTNNNEYKIGLWVRDGAAGIGTITYYEPSTKKFAAIRTWNN